MNIKDIVIDALNKSSIPQSWGVRVSVSDSIDGSKVRLVVSGSYDKISKVRKCKKTVKFNIWFRVSLSCEVTFEKITVCRKTLQNQECREIAKDELYSEFNYLRA